MNFRQHSLHLEQAVKTNFDTSGPINFERHHSTGQIGCYKLKSMILLERASYKIETQLEKVINRVTSVFRYIGEKFDWK